MANMSQRTRPGIATIAMGVLVGALAVAGLAGPANAHGWIGGNGSELTARVALQGNTGLGGAQWEPQSLEGPGGFPEKGPADGHIASAGSSRFPELDEQSSTRWVKNVVTSGPHTFAWTYTAPHNTDQWRYYITKNGWDPNAPLTRAEFQQIGVVYGDHKPANQTPIHTITIPADHKGYHVILAVWEVDDTDNAFYNVVDVDIRDGNEPVDNQAPSVPTGLAASVTSSSVSLTWNPSTDNKAVAGYRIERAVDGGAFTQLAESTEARYTDLGLAGSTTYRYQVRAIDTSGNVSAVSVAIAATTTTGGAADTQAPTAPGSLHSMETTATSVDLMWTASTDNRGVVGYRVERSSVGATAAYQPIATVTGTSYVDKTVQAGTTYFYHVVALDAAGNVSTASNVLTVTPTAATPTPTPTVTATPKPTATPTPTQTPTTPGTCAVAAWDAKAVYVGGDTASYNGLQYRAKWWVTGVLPTSTANGQPWEVVGPCGATATPSATPKPTATPTATATPKPTATATPTPTPSTGVCPAAWSSKTVYVGGETITYQGKTYKAQWWTVGNIPGTEQWGPWLLVSTCS